MLFTLADAGPSLFFGSARLVSLKITFAIVNVLEILMIRASAVIR